MRHNERHIPANRPWKQYVGIDARVTDEGRIEDYESDAVAAACERLVAALPGQ